MFLQINQRYSVISIVGESLAILNFIHIVICFYSYSNFLQIFYHKHCVVHFNPIDVGTLSELLNCPNLEELSYKLVT